MTESEPKRLPLLHARNSDGGLVPLHLCEWRGDRAYLTTLGAAGYLADPTTGDVEGVDSVLGVKLKLVPTALRRLRVLSHQTFAFSRGVDAKEDEALEVELAAAQEEVRKLKGLPIADSRMTSRAVARSLSDRELLKEAEGVVMKLRSLLVSCYSASAGDPAYSCRVCHGQWHPNDPEQHAEGCVVAEAAEIAARVR